MLKKLLAVFLALVLCVNPAFATWTFIAAKNVAGTNGGTTGQVDYHLADFLVVCVSSGGTAPTLTDSSSNSWGSPLVTVTNGTGYKTGIYYKQAPSVSSTQTFTITGAGTFSSLVVMGFSGSVASPLDQNNGGSNNTGSTTIASVSLAPQFANELVIQCLGMADSGGSAITIGTSGGTYTIPANGIAAASGANEGVAGAYLVQGAATATSPTWTDSNTGVTGLNSVGLSFKTATSAAQGKIGRASCRERVYVLV